VRKNKIKNSTIFTFYLLDFTVETKLYILIYLQRHVSERTIDLRSNYISAVGSFDVIVKDDLNYLTDGFGSGDGDRDDSMFALNGMKGDRSERSGWNSFSSPSAVKPSSYGKRPV